MLFKMRIYNRILSLFLLILLGAASALSSENSSLKNVQKLPKADSILVVKSAYRLHLISKGKVYFTAPISLGFDPHGHKQAENDGRTPEGHYKIVSHNNQSVFHKSLKTSYPNDEDRKSAKSRGVSPGGDIMIHGVPNEVKTWADWLKLKLREWTGNDRSSVIDYYLAEYSGRIYNWTRGCISVSNADMDQIYALVHDGTPIEIQP